MNRNEALAVMAMGKRVRRKSDDQIIKLQWWDDLPDVVDGLGAYVCEMRDTDEFEVVDDS